MRSVSLQSGPLSPVERAAIIEEFWASRNAWAGSINAERRHIWEQKWAGIREQDLAPGHTRRIEPVPLPVQMASPILLMRRGQEIPEESTGLDNGPVRRFDWQLKSVQALKP